MKLVQLVIQDHLVLVLLVSLGLLVLLAQRVRLVRLDVLEQRVLLAQ